MKMVYKVLAVLFAAFVLPLVALGAAAYLSMHSISRTATKEAKESTALLQRQRLRHIADDKALQVDSFFSGYFQDVQALARYYEYVSGNGSLFDVTTAKDLYPDKPHPGLPGYGFIHPVHGAYADFERRGPGCPWLPRRVVKGFDADPAARPAAAASLHKAMLMSQPLASMGEKYRGTLDLAWVVLASGATNVFPPYDYNEVIRGDPGVLDLDESGEDYVRLVDPQNNPRRETLWLDPYLDRFKGAWMTSCVAPLYEGDRFAGSVGLDILLSTLIEKVIATPVGDDGYAFLLTRRGRPVALPEGRVDELLWDQVHREAFRETLRPPTRQEWTPEMEAAIEKITLDQSPNEDLRTVVKEMKEGKWGTSEIALPAGRRLVSYAPVESTGWSVGVVVPMDQVEALPRKIEETIDGGTRAIVNQFVGAAAILVLLSVLVGSIMHYRIVRPLVLFTKKVEAVRWDNLAFEAPAARAGGEIGQLETKFGEMVGKLRGARDEITHEKERLAVMLRSIGDGVIATDVEGRVVLLNRVAERLTGWRQEEASGRPIGEVFRIVREGTREPCGDPVDRVLRSGEAAGLAGGTVLIARDGRERLVADSGAPMRDAASKVVGAVLVFRDVSEQKRMEQEVLKASKIESLGVLAGGIAHDFNNILTGILGNVSLARAMAGEKRAVAETLTEAEQAVMRAKDLTHQLLTFSRGGAPLRRTMSIGDVVKEATRFALRGSSSRGELSIAEDLRPIEGDEGQLSQVVHNIVINAAQSMPSGGTVAVAARNAVVAAGDPIPLPAGDYVLIAFADRGAGIPAEHIAKIFDPYFTTKEKGSGLGLTTSYAIVKNHDGVILADSTPGEGTTFRVYLPVSTGGRVAERSSQGRIVRGRGRVLFMDDDELILKAAAGMLTHLGYDVELAREGAEAVDRYRAAREEGKPFAAVIVDMTVPGGMGGKEAARRILAIDPAARLVVSSGYSNDPVLSSYEAHGFKACVSKPYRLSDLSEALARVIGL